MHVDFAHGYFVGIKPDPMRKIKTLALLSASVFALSASAQQNTYDSRIDSYVGLRYSCGGSVQPVLRIQNVGGATMTSCDIDVLKNGITNNTFNWVLASAAATNVFRQPTLPVISGIQPGDVLEFHILTVNGQPDEGSDGNVLQVPLTDQKGDADSYQVQVQVLTDDNPSQTTWTIKNELGAVVAQSPTYTDPGTVTTSPLSLSPDHCYNFEVKDTGGDGFGIAREDGYAKVTCMGQDVVSVSGNFASLFREGVTTGTQDGCLPTQLTTSADPLVSCGATGLMLNGTSTIHATAVPGVNKYQFKFTNVSGQPAYSRTIASLSRSLTLTKWSTLPLKKGRTYNVQVRSSFNNGTNWCAYAGSCTISISNIPGEAPRSLDAMDADSELSFTIFPNPAESGRFHLSIAGLDGATGEASVDVFDLFGKRVGNSVITLIGDDAPIAIDMPELAAGIYFVKLTIGEDALTRRLVVH